MEHPIYNGGNRASRWHYYPSWLEQAAGKEAKIRGMADLFSRFTGAPWSKLVDHEYSVLVDGEWHFVLSPYVDDYRLAQRMASDLNIELVTNEGTRCGAEHVYAFRPLADYEKKTVHQWIHDLPDGYRELAVAAIMQHPDGRFGLKGIELLQLPDKSTPEALCLIDTEPAFPGRDWWYQVKRHYYFGANDPEAPLPPLPPPIPTHASKEEA